MYCTVYFALYIKTNKDISQFLLSIQYNDFEQGYTENQLGETHRELYQAFNIISDKFRHLRSEKEIQNQLMQTIVRSVDTGIFCTDNTGKCLMMNAALKQLLHQSYIPSFSALQKITPNIFDVLQNIQVGKRQTVREIIQNEIVEMAVQLYIMKIKDEEIYVYTLYNIHNELSDQEVKSWQKLIRILSHEIMNSITPIASISSSATQLIKSGDGIATEEAKQIKEAFQVIQKRSEGLMRFTETYRKLTRIPPPKLETIDARSFFDEIQTLYKHDMEQKGITLRIQFLFKKITLQADPVLLKQACINLIKNAMDALEGIADPAITILVDKTPEGKTAIEIRDNGCGIPQDVAEQIFIPFFTTRENGSGIGLSLSQQIIRAHGGNIYLQSKPGEGTVVRMRV